MPLLWCLALCLAAHPDPATVAAQLRAAEQDRATSLAAQTRAAAAAATAQRQADKLAEARIAAAARLRDAETATNAAAARLDDLASERREAERRLAQQADNLGPLLPLIERLALYPLETLLAIPAAPEQTLRGVTVLQGITRDMERQAKTLVARRAQVASLTSAIAAETPKLAAAAAAQAAQAAALDAQLTKARQTMTGAEQQGLAAARQAADAASRAATLRDAIAAIETAQARAAAAARSRHARTGPAAVLAGPGLGPARGAIAAPVIGVVIHGFGDPTDSGPSNGISYRPAPSARVVAPCGGTVVFAAPFRSYGKLLILDCGSHTNFVLAGLDRLDTDVGRAVRPGEPVGAMPAWDPAASAARPTLYVELRQSGAPINPAPYLRARP